VTVTLPAVLDWLGAFRTAVAENAELLTQLDAAIGDADHGTNMNRGMTAVMDRLATAAPEDIGGALNAVGMTLISTVGGASGPLYGSFFLKAGATLAGRTDADPVAFVDALDAGVAGVAAIGKAQTGEKTMLDALVPAVARLRERVNGDVDLGDALADAARAAEDGMNATIPMLATKGRASYLGERSIGHQDPGATSSHLLLRTLADTVGKSNGGH
jgi:dihydroxyacetone kinase-like protein